MALYFTEIILVILHMYYQILYDVDHCDSDSKIINYLKQLLICPE